MKRLQQACARVVGTRAFDNAVIAMILATAVGLGVDTSVSLNARFGAFVGWVYQAALVAFILEAAMKLTAVAPRFERYFRNGWNLFDFTVLVFALIPDTGQFALIARLVRLLRVLRLVTVVPQLRIIVATLVRSLPGLGHVMMLILVIFYVYAVAGVHLFRAVVMINFVIAVVIDNLHEARLEVAFTEGEETLRAIREEAANARDTLQRIEARVERLQERS